MVLRCVLEEINGMCIQYKAESKAKESLAAFSGEEILALSRAARAPRQEA